MKRGNGKKVVIATLIVSALMVAMTACKQRSYNFSDKYSAASGNVDRSGFFDHNQLWYARVTGWDKSKIQSWEFTEKTKVNGAQFELFRLSKKVAEKTWCPTPSELEPNARIFSTTAFNISLRGDKSKGTPKGSYLVEFEKEDERFLELKRLHLVAMFNDLSQMREALSQTLLSFVKVPAPRNSYLRFCLDDVYRGLYINIEEVDQKFIAEVLGRPQFTAIYEGRDGAEPDAGQLMLCGGSGAAAEKYNGKGYKKISGQAEAQFQDFEKLLQSVDENISASIDVSKSETLSEIFDMETFIRWMAVNQLIGGWDNYYFNAKNYFLVNSGTIEKPYFHWVAIDLDNTFGVSFTQHDWSKVDIFDWESVKGGSHQLPLVRLALSRPEWKKKYTDTLAQLISAGGAQGSAQTLLFNEISALWKLIESSVTKESNSETIDYAQTDPFKMAHTARQFTTSDIRTQVTEDSVDAQDPYGWANMKSPHLRTYIKRKWKNVAEQLNRAQ